MSSFRPALTLVPAKYTTPDGVRLGQWVNVQRRTKEGFSSERRTRLEAINGWTWNRRDAGWEEAFTRLQQYVETEGHARVPFGHRTADGEKLGLWVSNQRLKKGRLPPERRQRLQALKGWLWNTREAAWEDGFGQLQRYVETEGHAVSIPRQSRGL